MQPVFKFDGAIGQCVLALLALIAAPAITHVSAQTRAAGASEPGDSDTSSQLKLVEVHAFDKGGTVYHANFLPDGRRALIGGDGLDPPMHLWDVEKGQTIRRFGLPNDHGISVAASPDGRLAVSSGLNGAVTVWDVETADVVASFVHPGIVSGIVFSPYGRTLATSAADGTARLWNAQTGTDLRVFEGNGSLLTGVAFTPDGERLLTSSTDKMVRIWKVDGGGVLQSLPHPDLVWSMAVSPNGNMIVSGTGGRLVGAASFQDYAQGDDNMVRVWDLRTGRLEHELSGHTHVVRRIAISPDGRLAASGGLDKTLRLWDLAAGRQIVRINSEGWVIGVDFSPDGKHLLAVGGVHKQGRKWVRSPQERVRLFRIVE